MQIKKFNKSFDELQLKYGDKNLDAIYGAGCISNPKISLVFMNPTGRNVSSSKEWTGLKAPWIGTKNVWKMFFQLGFFNEDFFEAIKSKKPQDWTFDFSNTVYEKVSKASLYITNLSKATKLDSTNPTNKEFKEYLDLFKEEIFIVNPKVIIVFGGQVSSVILSKNIKLGDYRKKYEDILINGTLFKVFPVYYPVGQGIKNIDKSKEDISWIIKNFC